MLPSNVTMAAATESSTAESSFSEEVSKLMGQGKRHLVCSEVLQAVKCFEEATLKLDGKYGSGSDECGEAYLFYGKALLELARTENGVLGNALKDVEPKSGESSDEDEEKMGAVGPKIKEMSPRAKEKIREDVQDAMAEDEEADSGEKDKEGKDQDNNKRDEKDKDEEEKNESEAESGAISEDTTSTEKTAEEKNKGKEGEKEGDKEENKDKEEVEVAEEGGKEAKEGGKEAEEEGKEAEEGENEAGKGGKKAEEEAKEGEEQGQEGEEEEGEDEAMEEEEGEDEGEGNADDDQEGEDNAEGAAAEGQEDEEADVPTMQLAWEFLELARLIFLRQESKESQLNLGEVYLKLGEIQLEQEQFATAAEEFQKCLDLQMKHLEPDDRLIAETAYNMGLAYSLQPNYTKAKDFFSQAFDVIKLRTTKLEARIAEEESKSKGKEKATDDNPCVVDRKELEELQNLYPEIKARVDDAQEMMNSASTQPESTTEEGFGLSGQGKTDVPASTIPVKQPATMIPVRRKRKPEESGSTVAEDTEAPVKRARQEEDPPAAPVITENGHVPNGGVTSTEQN